MLINTFHPDPKVEQWVQNLPDEVKQNTMSTRILQDVCRNSDATLAEQVVNAIKAKRWEKGVALMVHGFPQVVKFKSWADWCGAYLSEGGLKQHPSWFFRKVTTELIGEESIEAAKLLAQNMTRDELLAYCRDTPRQRGFISIARGNVISHGPDWAGVVNLLEELSKRGHGVRGPAEEKRGDDTSPLSSKVSSTSKEALRRRLLTMANDEDKSEAERTDASSGLAVLDRNGTYRAACDAAGIECKRTSSIVYVRKDLALTADRLVDLLGKDHVSELITLLSERIK